MDAVNKLLPEENLTVFTIRVAEVLRLKIPTPCSSKRYQIRKFHRSEPDEGLCGAKHSRALGVGLGFGIPNRKNLILDLDIRDQPGSFRTSRANIPPETASNRTH
jgi:hypothetical protein